MHVTYILLINYLGILPSYPWSFNSSEESEGGQSIQNLTTRCEPASKFISLTRQELGWRGADLVSYTRQCK